MFGIIQDVIGLDKIVCCGWNSSEDQYNCVSEIYTKNEQWREYMFSNTLKLFVKYYILTGVQSSF